ncbi:MAG: hypothetical protein HKN23_11700, partial [Verrucomicrobiales bacterium]|nr:hypothetical protein [Verrucomicrobiales bacterium]
VGKLASEGIHLDYEDRKWIFPRGLVLSGVKIFASEAKEQKVLEVGNFGVDLDVWRFLSTRSAEGLQAVVTMDGSDAALYSGGEEVCTILNMRANLFATREKLAIKRLRGTVNGLDFDIEGMINLPEPASTDPAVPTDAASDAGNVTEGPVLDFAFLEPAMEQVVFTSSESGKNPLLRVNVSLDTADQTSLHASGKLSGRSFTWKDLPLDFADITFDYSQKLGVIELLDTKLGYQGGTVSGRMQILLERDTINIESLTSTANLIDLAAQFDPEIQKTFQPIEFVGNPDLSLNGVVNTADFWASTLVMDYQHWDGFFVATGGKKVPVRELDGRVTLRGETLNTESFQAEILGGNLDINGYLKPKEQGLPFAAAVVLRMLPMEKLAELGATADAGLSGLLSADFRGKGVSNNLAALQGSGKVRVESGKLYSVPVLGPIQKNIANVLPIFGTREKSNLQGSYLIESGVLVTNDLLIRSDGTKIKVDGSINLAQQTTDFEAKANLDGPLGLATGLVSEVLVVEGSGPLANPDVELKSVPDGISNLTSGALKSAVGIAGEGVRNIGESTVGEGARVIEENARKVGEGLKGVLKGLRGEKGTAKGTPPAVEPAPPAPAPEAAGPPTPAPQNP